MSLGFEEEEGGVSFGIVWFDFFFPEGRGNWVGIGECVGVYLDACFCLVFQGEVVESINSPYNMIARAKDQGSDDTLRASPIKASNESV